jgi:hypothetical protein
VIGDAVAGAPRDHFCRSVGMLKEAERPGGRKPPVRERSWPRDSSEQGQARVCVLGEIDRVRQGQFGSGRPVDGYKNVIKYGAVPFWQPAVGDRRRLIPRLGEVVVASVRPPAGWCVRRAQCGRGSDV